MSSGIKTIRSGVSASVAAAQSPRSLWCPFFPRALALFSLQDAVSAQCRGSSSEHSRLRSEHCSLCSYTEVCTRLSPSPLPSVCVRESCTPLVCLWRSEDNLWEMSLCSYHVDPRD